MRIIITVLFLNLISLTAISDEQKACYMNFQSRDLALSPSLAAGQIAHEIDETCKVGDHLFIEPLNKFALAQLVTHICNPKFEIIFQRLQIL